ncbi:hypothetical protein D1224_06920 [Henriciella barbarensis]|uniref:Uncharacterized protein n=1 Tax=Henriciella barbarensis TaxID=86342 RepID=A0A399R0H7_9PROT|nr:hypothetical protein [Henriciella barbarensis]RIJ23974.1 hypothetical protein D1224_06920 [Henriciella barbarensis]
MSLAYPLAISADDALKAGGIAARTRYEAESLAGDTPILSLETEWLKPEAADVQALIKEAESGEAKGFIQIYEDADGKPVLAVTYWKLKHAPTGEAAASAPKPAKPEPAPPSSPKPKKQATEIDHTDDLYFRNARSKRSRKSKQADPRQMDLFVSPDQRGYEHKDPHNPNTMLTDEEGDGTTFGG